METINAFIVRLIFMPRLRLFLKNSRKIKQDYILRRKQEYDGYSLKNGQKNVLGFKAKPTRAQGRGLLLILSLWTPNCRAELIKSVFQGVECFWLSILPIPATDKVQYMDIDKSCPFCGLVDETNAHVFFSFTTNAYIWLQVKRWLGITRFMSTIDSALKFIRKEGRGSGWQAKAKRIALASTIYHIWTERNKEFTQQIFETLTQDTQQKEINIWFETSEKTSKGMRVTNNNELNTCMYLINNDNSFRKSHFIIDGN
ncbi:hypothetical protein RND71_038034 [Anisodus tanguticus]|uniref:Reverse transcriptase zinc-binding domain-containing protein n=1 Tax=Anisodus tanguticus TaxID=243964 RepID=A0AAE1URT1_9SOLA|nr:hypothetical protein RND71_038034 [Anisodus tanguticus]